MNIDICVCTYRRPHVEETLTSLARLRLPPDWHIRVIVADNDETPSARALVEQTAQKNGLALTYIHAPARNISIARNACLNAATAAMVAFIDDDEIPDPDWLAALVGTMENSKADIVLGPLVAAYGSESPEWIRKGDFLSKKPVWVNGEIITGYTGNVLLQRTSPALNTLRFRQELGRTGGEDTMYFTAAHQAGCKISYTPNAIVTEAVPAQRAQLSWLIKRYFRAGQTHGHLLLERDGTDFILRTKNILLAFGKALFCFVMIVPNLTQPARAYYWFLRGVMHIGVFARLLGKTELVQYG